MAAVPEKARGLIDGILNAKGIYVAEEGAYKFVMPREAATIVWDYQSLSPNIGLNSWATFSAGVHREAMLTGQLLLLGDEVNEVLGAALDNGLEITGLADSTLFIGPRVYALDFTGFGSFEALAKAVRKSADQIQVVRRKTARTSQNWPALAFPQTNTITGPPLDNVLAMRGTVTGGIYKAAIGRRAL